LSVNQKNRLWGKNTFETEDILRQEIGDDDIKIALIGPAGENKVRGSVIIIDKAKAAGGSGVGCVMGDKKLKAIVVRGHGKIEVAQPEQFMQVITKCYKKSKDEPNTEMMRKAPFNIYSNPDWEGWNTNIVIKNGQDDQWGREKRIRLMNPVTGIPSMQKLDVCLLWK